MTGEQQTIETTNPTYYLEVGRNKKASYKKFHTFCCSKEEAITIYDSFPLLPGQKKRLVDANTKLVILITRA